ncbi:hypothetical protein F443_00643 [Phytophthora nicotianae P1569]|uniref:HAT C-terminal dimerisation domain-containing protein n=1 Tax=Phytophthora nicotianae P1569 TaxID=1317065 RepID=V9FZW7_PHYNI|nr:hypothetical protein F443_00643 [Phytophthora nicotianae P1569]
MELLPDHQSDLAEAPKRGRPPSSLSSNFYRLNEKCNKTMWWTICKYCYVAHVNDKARVPFPVSIHGRKASWEKHLSDCSYYVQATGKLLNKESDTSEYEVSRSNKLQCASPPDFTSAEQRMFWRLLLEFQAEAMLPAFFVELMSFKRLLTFLNARCGATGAVPSRQVLGGRVLNEYADLHSTEQRNHVMEIQNRSGARVNFLSDVWENIAKQHVLGCQVALFGRMMTHGLVPTGSRHDGLAIAQQMEDVMEELIASQWNVGSAVTDNAGQCRRARGILALRYPNIVFLFCFAHDVNNLVKAVLKTVFKQVSEAAAGAASFLNTSTSKWLTRAIEAMENRYGDSFAVFTLCETRWNSMQACFASLLRARGALEDLVFKYRNDSDLPSKLRILADSEFWNKLESAEKVVRPLCTASFRLQRDENTVADVVRSYMDVYIGFAATEWSHVLVECVETRWNACEQPLFMLGYFLHPRYVSEARKLPSTVLTQLDDICQFAQYYYRRFIGDDDSTLRGDVFDWIEGSYTTSRVIDFSSGLVVKFWQYERKSKPSSKLPLLALTILAIAVNTATCERLFSELALIHTPKRNQMATEKTLKHQVMRQYVREKNRSEKSAPTSSKKLLRIIDPRERPRLATPQPSAQSTPVQVAASITGTPVPQACTNTPGHLHHEAATASPALQRTLFPAEREGGSSLVRSSSTPRCTATPGRTPSGGSIVCDVPSQNVPPVRSPNDGTNAHLSTPVTNSGPSLTTEMTAVSLSGSLLEEYLDHFDWEEFGDDGDEETIGVWGSILNTSRITSHEGDDDADERSFGTYNGGDLDGDEDESANQGNPGCSRVGTSRFTTKRGTYEDLIPAADRRPYPETNDPAFPQEKKLTGIRARKTSLASLVAK